MKKIRTSLLLLTSVFLVGCSKGGSSTTSVPPSSSATSKTTTSSSSSSSSQPVVSLDHINVEAGTKINYAYDDEFESPIVYAYYSNSTSLDVSSLATSSGFTKSEVGSQVISVSYTEKQITKTTQYTVYVAEPPVELVSIEFEDTPKTSYNFDEAFEYPTVNATFSDASIVDVTTESTWSGDYTDVAGTHEVKVTYTYGDVEKELTYDITVGDAPRAVKFAIFADVQLCGKTAINGESVINQGSTANAPIALKNHFEFCKKNNISTILMNGDITNQANSHYYEYYQSILESVYGEETESNPYPEIIMNMGNHEWWNGVTEKEGTDVNAIGLFRQYANIDSEYLVEESETKYSVVATENLPSYYKVINGVPFLVISGDNSSGTIGDSLYNELEDWLLDIKQLDSVKKGGPIFVQYHYALNSSMTHGQGAGNGASTLETLLADTPNAVVFTGDTHFPGVNERAINQVDFTTINLGSSSYSRMVDESAVICDDFYNVSGGSGKSDKLVGNAKYKEAYTPTIQVIDLYKDNNFTIDRYFTSEGGESTKVGETWSLGPVKSKSDFKYTNARFQDKKASEELYGAQGLSWEAEDKVSFGYDEINGKMTVRFPDVNEYHFCEHYLIDVNGAEFDVVSNYYKYLPEKESNYYLLDVEEAAEYNVKVTAYDFFDNPSLNTLSSADNDPNACIDAIDAQAASTYSDIQVRNNVTDCASSSNSSIEYFYQGKYPYQYGAILSSVIERSKASSEDCRDFITIKDTDKGVAPVFKMKVKNLNESDLLIGITVVDKDGDWKTDFGKEYQQTVKSGDWKELSWDLNGAFGFTSSLDINKLSFKAKLSDSTSEGYSMNFLIDDLDVVPGEIKKGAEFNVGKDYIYDIKTSIPVSSGTLTFDMKFSTDNTTYVDICFGDGWYDYFGYFRVYPTTKAGDYNGFTSVTLLDDGYTRFEVTFSQMTIKEKDPEDINLFYIRGKWSTGAGRVLVNA